MVDENAVRGWIDAVHCTDDWLVFKYGEHGDAIPEGLDKGLSDLKAQGITDFSCTDQQSYSINDVQRICDDLGLIRGNVIHSSGVSPKIVVQWVPGGSARMKSVPPLR